MTGQGNDGDRTRGGGGHSCPCCEGHERGGGEQHRHGAGHHRGERERGRDEGAGAGAREGGAGEGAGFFGPGTGQTIAIGALAAAGAMLFAANREKLKPAVKGTLKEYYRFSDWLGSNFAQVKEDLSDMAAEARHDYEQEMAAHLELIEKERQLVQRLANMAKKRTEEG